MTVLRPLLVVAMALLTACATAQDPATTQTTATQPADIQPANCPLKGQACKKGVAATQPANCPPCKKKPCDAAAQSKCKKSACTPCPAKDGSCCKKCVAATQPANCPLKGQACKKGVAATQPADCPLKGQACKKKGYKKACGKPLRCAWLSEGCVGDAVVILVPTQGSDVRGTVTFKQLDDGQVRVTADVTGLEPGSEHAWHIHEFGNLSDPHGKATGGHYNPQGHPHGLPGNPDRHAGDLGNLVADEAGRAVKTLDVDNITVAGPVNPILGRGLIIHAKLDDGGQPTGNAGARIAQGVIGVAASPSE